MNGFEFIALFAGAGLGLATYILILAIWDSRN